MPEIKKLVNYILNDKVEREREEDPKKNNLNINIVLYGQSSPFN